MKREEEADVAGKSISQVNKIKIGAREQYSLILGILGL
jgi:hypothetical protein